MKYVLLLLIVPFLLLGACTDVPRYTADQVIEVARSYSPHCRRPPFLRPSWEQGSDYVPTCGPGEDNVEASFGIEYLGDGVWSVTKTCPVNSACSASWYFYEDTGKLVER